MDVSKINIGNKVEISLQLDGNKSSKTYISKVESADDPTEVFLQIPSSLGQLVKLPLSDNYSMLFFTKDGMYRFRAAIVGYKTIDKFKYLVVSLLSGGEKVQRRAYFRYNCDIEMQFYKYDENNNIIRDNLCEGTMLDLGGGGARFLSNEEMEVKDNIQCVIVLMDEFLFANAVILYKDKQYESKFKYQYRVKFTEIMDLERDKIIQYVFNEQRKRISRARQKR